MAGTYASRMKELMRKYGRTALGVHFTVYAASLAGCYYAIESKVDVHHLLIKLHLLTDKEVADDKNEEQRGWFSRMMSSSGSSLALAVLCNKALLPVRVPITVGLTPVVHKFLQQRRLVSAATAAAAAEAASNAPQSTAQTSSQARRVVVDATSHARPPVGAPKPSS